MTMSKASVSNTSAVLRHRFVAKTNRPIDTPEGMDGPPIPYPYGHCLGFLESL